MKLAHWLGCAALACASAVSFAQTPPARAPAAPAAPATPAAQAPQPAPAAPAADTQRNEAGKIDLVAGSVTVVGADQKQRVPKKGEKLFEGDSILTDANGELHAELADGGVLAVRPNTAMLITKYQANGDAADTSIFGLLKGSFRSLTGWIGKSNQANYKIITPTATMGVRGTDHEPTVIPEGAKEGQPGTYDRVHAGASFIEGKSGSVEVAPGRVGFFAAHGRDRPRVLDQVPAFYRPARNDARLAGRHARIAATHDQRREQRVKAVQAARTRAESRAAPRQDAAQARRAAVEQRKQQAQQAQQARQTQQAAQKTQQAARQEQQKSQQKAQQKAQQKEQQKEQQKARQQQQAAQQSAKKEQQKAQQARQTQAGQSAKQAQPGQRPQSQAKQSQAAPKQRDSGSTNTRSK